MLKHLFKMIWNKKKQNFLLITEMFISFLVIFAVFTLLTYFYRNYKTPMGMQYEHVWTINYNNSLKTQNKDSISIFYDDLKKTIQALPQVKSVAYGSTNTPFSQSAMMNGVEYKGKSISPNYCVADEDYAKVLQVKMLQGAWFTKGDIAAKTSPVVINQKLKEAFFGSENAIGKFLGAENNFKVIGVIDNVKMNGDYKEPGYWYYQKTDSNSIGWMSRILVHVSADADAAFESRLYKTVANTMKDSNIEIEHLTNKLKQTNYFALVPMIILSIVACFLIINVALGLFGVLWYNINKRRGEIGLRRAVGATAASVSSQLVTESLLLATIALITGSFFAIQFPLLNVFDLPAVVYITALVLAIIFIYVLVLVCSLYPGKQAAAIYPAVALHEE